MSIRVLRLPSTSGSMGVFSPRAQQGDCMPGLSNRHVGLIAIVFVVGLALGSIAHAQVVTTGPSSATASWTIRVNGDIRWQQVTPAGALLVSTDGALVSVDVER